MIKKTVCVSYGRSLLWIALFMAVICGMGFTVELIAVDFIHGNPNRTQTNAALTMLLFTPIISIVAIAATSIILAVPQCFQAMLVAALTQWFGRRAYFGVLLALPLTTALSWYCFEYLIPLDANLGIDVGPDWTPHQYGLTEQRYLTTLVVQFPITLFSLLHCNASIQQTSKKRIISVALALAVVLGGVLGYRMTESQLAFL